MIEAQRIILRALDEAKRNEKRRERKDTRSGALAGFVALVCVTVVAVAPFELLGIWHLEWTPYVSCAIWTGLVVWLAESKRGKRLLGPRNSN